MPAIFGRFSEASTSASRWDRASHSASSARQWKCFDRDLAFQLRVGRAVHVAHAARRGDLIRTETRARVEGHR